MSIKIHKMRLAKSPLDKIVAGIKIIESRLYDDKRKLIDVGDQIEFSQNDNPDVVVKRNVVALYRYSSFSDMFSDFPSQYFGGESKEALITEIEQFYPLDEQTKFGVIGIRLS